METQIQTFKLVFVLGVLGISTITYLKEHRKKNYATGKNAPIESPKHFASVYHLIQFFVFFSAIDSATPWFNHIGVLFDQQITTWIGTAISVFAIALFLIAKRHLGRNYSPCFDAYVPAQIIQSGVYRYIRHPIYTANLALLVGFFLITGHVLVAVAWGLLAAYYAKSAVIEEKRLAQEFQGYSAYISRSYRFIPYVI